MVTVLGGVYMPTKEADEADEETKPPTKSIRLSRRTVEMIEEISEATGQSLAKTADRLFGAGLVAEHHRIQDRLKRVRATKAKTAEEQRQALKELGG